MATKRGGWVRDITNAIGAVYTAYVYDALYAKESLGAYINLSYIF